MNLLEHTKQALSVLFPEPAQMALPPEAIEGVETSNAQPLPERQPGSLKVEFARQGYHLDVLCLPEQVVAVAEIMDREHFFLESIAGVDWLDRGQIEVLYDFNRLGGEHCRIMVHTSVPRTEPILPTISGVFPSADWHERETFDFYGVHFQDHPHLIRILLPEDADFYPLRKDYMP